MNAAMKKGRVTILATVALGAVILLNTGSSALAQTGVGGHGGSGGRWNRMEG